MPNADIQHVPVDQIRIEAQVRRDMDEEALAGLEQSVRARGILIPILVQRDERGLRALDGHRRLIVAHRIGLATIPAVVQAEPLSEQEIVEVQLVTACQREELSPIDKALAIKKLIAANGWTACKVAEQIGMSQATVAKHVSLLTLPDKIQDSVASGEVPVSAAYELTKVQNPQMQADLARRLAAGQLTRDGLTTAMRSSRRSVTPPASAESEKSRITALLAPGRTVTVCAAGLTLERLIEILEELLAKARKARPQGLSLTTFLKLLKDQATA